MVKVKRSLDVPLPQKPDVNLSGIMIGAKLDGQTNERDIWIPVFADKQIEFSELPREQRVYGSDDEEIRSELISLYEESPFGTIRVSYQEKWKYYRTELSYHGRSHSCFVKDYGWCAFKKYPLFTGLTVEDIRDASLACGVMTVFRKTLQNAKSLYLDKHPNAALRGMSVHDFFAAFDFSATGKSDVMKIRYAPKYIKQRMARDNYDVLLENYNELMKGYPDSVLLKKLYDIIAPWNWANLVEKNTPQKTAINLFNFDTDKTPSVTVHRFHEAIIAMRLFFGKRFRGYRRNHDDWRFRVESIAPYMPAMIAKYAPWEDEKKLYREERNRLHYANTYRPLMGGNYINRRISRVTWPTARSAWEYAISHREHVQVMQFLRTEMRAMGVPMPDPPKKPENPRKKRKKK